MYQSTRCHQTRKIFENPLWEDVFKKPAQVLFDGMNNYTDHFDERNQSTALIEVWERSSVRLSYSKDPATNELKIMYEIEERDSRIPKKRRSHLTKNNEQTHTATLASFDLEILNFQSLTRPFGLKHQIYSGGGKMDYKDAPGGSGGTVISTVAKIDYQYKYQGQERQDELGLNWDSFKWRNYDYAIGRFMSIDPLTEEYVDWGPYVFSGNRVIDARELEGLEPFLLSVRSFAPFDTFGATGSPGNYKGDGSKRGYTTSSTASSRMSLSAGFIASAGNISNTYSVGRGNYTTNVETGKSVYSPAELKDSFKTDVSVNGGKVDGQYKFDLSGKNSMIYPTSPDIDIMGKFNMNSIDLGKDGSLLQISGSINGDGFPASETFISDASGNSVFLGVSGAVGSVLTTLPGKGTSDMSSFNIIIQFNAEGNITNVLSGGNSYTIGEWNKQFQQLDPKDDKVATRINN